MSRVSSTGTAYTTGNRAYSSGYVQTPGVAGVSQAYVNTAARTTNAAPQTQAPVYSQPAGATNTSRQYANVPKTGYQPTTGSYQRTTSNTGYVQSSAKTAPASTAGRTTTTASMQQAQNQINSLATRQRQLYQELQMCFKKMNSPTMSVVDRQKYQAYIKQRRGDYDTITARLNALTGQTPATYAYPTQTKK